MTGLLVRSTATNWAKGSVLAVDAGTHLSAVIRIFEEHLPQATDATVPESILAPGNSTPRPRAGSTRQSRPLTHQASFGDPGYGRSTPTPSQQIDVETPARILTTGPFSDFELPFESVKANAAFFMRSLISTYLVTHPHLDHISGFAINTASFQHTSRPKRIAALPSTIDAIKTHIFNDVIWPNMSDEDGGVGFVSYMRLVEGGNIQFGDGESRGYIEVCDGLAVKCWSVSHGQCMRKHNGHGSRSGSTHDAFQDIASRRASQPAVMTPTTNLQHSQTYGHPADMMRAVDSSAFFLRDDHTGSEVLIFGDVEPDSLSIAPRNHQVWSDAATKLVSGLLLGILIECSYDNSQSDETLFGHLSPRHLVAELKVLAGKANALRPQERIVKTTTPARKRKRQSNGLTVHDETGSQVRSGRTPSQTKRKTRRRTISPATPATLVSEDSDVARPARDLTIDIPNSIDEGEWRSSTGQLPLEGLQVVIIHVKETLKDGPEPGETILSQLKQAGIEEGLGCTFVISKAGTSIWL